MKLLPWLYWPVIGVLVVGGLAYLADDQETLAGVAAAFLLFGTSAMTARRFLNSERARTRDFRLVVQARYAAARLLKSRVGFYPVRADGHTESQQVRPVMQPPLRPSEGQRGRVANRAIACPFPIAIQIPCHAGPGTKKRGRPLWGGMSRTRASRAAGCGVGGDHEPREHSTEDVAFDLDDRAVRSDDRHLVGVGAAEDRAMSSIGPRLDRQDAGRVFHYRTRMSSTTPRTPQATQAAIRW